MQQFIDIIKTEFPEVDDICVSEGTRKAVRISWKTNDDDSRKNKRCQPIIIQLNEDFDFTGDLGDKLSKEFAAFIRNKRANFKIRTTNDRNETPTPEYWIFPPED